ncbi:MAG: DUF1700 domain-containing protein [Eubacteriales bacterium]
MKKQEFLNQLQKSLSGEVEQSEVNSTMAFYREYLNDQVKQGYSEAEVLEKLGDPRLLAKTIIETSDKKSQFQSHDRGYEEVDSDDSYGNYKNKKIKLPNWLFSLIIIVLILIFLSLVFTILRIFLPYILLALGAAYIYHWIRCNMNR